MRKKINREITGRNKGGEMPILTPASIGTVPLPENSENKRGTYQNLKKKSVLKQIKGAASIF